MDAPTPYMHRLRVRYHECDMQGIVFNGHYYTWIDDAHTEWLRALLGTPVASLHEHGVDVVVAESSARYLASARFDQVLDVEVRLESLTTTSMTTTHTFRHDGELLVEGRIRHVCVATEQADGSWSKAPWPDELREAFAPHLPLAPG